MTAKRLPLVFVILLFSACAMLDDSAPKKPATTGLIATPPSYYSTTKAKYLGAKYKENLDRMVERIVRNPKTSSLQFANNISSVGGIGFFTHSATKSPDERYLEVVLATPETFETKGDVSEKVQQLFSRYGFDLLGIISGDGDIYRDRELSGYGLNLAWRNVISEPSGNRVTLARAIIYFSKERVLNFLRSELNQSDLLGEAVIYAVDEDGPLNLVSYKPQELRPDVRPTIREDDLTNVPVVSKQPQSPSTVTSKEAGQKIDPKLEVAKKVPAIAVPGAKAIEQETKAEAKKPVASAQKSSAKSTQLSETTVEAAKQGSPAQLKDSERVPSTKQADSNLPSAPTNEAKGETESVAQKSAAQAVATAPASATATPVVVPIEKAGPATVAKPATSTGSDIVGEQGRETSGEATRATTPTITPVEKPETGAPAVAEPVKPAPRAAAPKVIVEAPKVETTPRAKPAAVSVANPAEKQPSVAPEKTEGKTAAPPSLVTKTESAVASATPSREIGPRTAPEKIPVANASEAGKVPAPVVKTAEPTQPMKSTAISPVTPVVKSETRLPQAQVPAAAVKAKVEEKVASLPTREPAATETGKVAQENKISEIKTSEVTPRQAPVAKVPVQIPASAQTKPAPAPSVAKVEAHPMEVKPSPPAVTAKPKETAAEKPANEQVALLRKPAEAISEKAPTAKATVPTPMPEQAKPAPPISVAKPQAPAIEVKPTPPAVAAKSKETVAEKPANEQVVLLNKPIELVPERKPLTHSAQKALEGFIIQVAFNDKEKARNWAESMERRGYAVSVTEAGTDGALRVRLGNFSLRDDAERQLRNFKQDGLSGIVINLPQAFRPEARSSVP